MTYTAACGQRFATFEEGRCHEEGCYLCWWCDEGRELNRQFDNDQAELAAQEYHLRTLDE